MSIVYSQAAINARLQGVITAIDAGAGNGQMKLLAGGAVVSTIALVKPSGTVNSGVLTFSGTLSDPSAAGTGTITTAQVLDSNNNVVVSGFSVGIPGTSVDIVISNGLNSTLISSGQTVQVLAATITGS